jgi:hypothetical protein
VAESVSGRWFSSDVEGSAYVFVTEALANTLRHSDSPSVDVCLEVVDDNLLVAVADAGRVIEPADIADASGLAGLADRIRALGRVDARRQQPGRRDTPRGTDSNRRPEPGIVVSPRVTSRPKASRPCQSTNAGASTAR